jgi:hypothetical protein
MRRLTDEPDQVTGIILRDIGSEAYAVILMSRSLVLAEG